MKKKYTTLVMPKLPYKGSWEPFSGTRTWDEWYELIDLLKTLNPEIDGTSFVAGCGCCGGEIKGFTQ